MITLYVIVAAFVAAAINSVAGGGTFLTFPTLTAGAGLSEKVANMTSTVGLVPGSAASIVAARADLRHLPRSMVATYAAISLIGGAIGSILLIRTSPGTFRLVIPWLLGFATLVFAFSKPIARWAGRQHGDRSARWTAIVAAIQLLIAIYGGYFGAGIGVLMMAGLSFAGLDSVHHMNALKVLLATLINGVAATLFLFNPATNLPLAGAMAAASVVGGFLGMVLARRIPQEALRGVVLLAGASLTVVYFYRAYAA